MTEIDLQARFPDLRPTSTAPTLFSWFGCGLRLCGSRDRDEEIGAYLTNHCLCLLFVPVLLLRSYRVAPTPTGLVLLGLEPLSGTGKLWNLIALPVIVAAVCGFGWAQYTQSPEYRAAEALAEAERCVEQGELSEAAGLYGEIAVGRTSHKNGAIDGLAALLAGPIESADAAETAETFEAIVETTIGRRAVARRIGLLDRGLEVASSRAADHPRAALRVLDALEPLVSDPSVDDTTRASIGATRRRLLEGLVERHPEDAGLASQLAVVYEKADQPEKCEELLVPHRDRLGSGEGARVLGQIWIRAGKLQESLPLLEAYTSGVPCSEAMDSKRSVPDTLVRKARTGSRRKTSR